jgi:TolB-like protein/Tfp pilus assembly protein PilF
MGGELPKPASIPTGAVFLSYASQDAEAAKRICDALRAAGIEVWFDQSELRGGDAWDRKIRDQIRHCALFIPIISAHSQARLEGYFRREWKFAVERKRDIADELVFLLPVVIDETPERGASVPEGFHDVQWTRLPGGAGSQEFIDHVSQLLTGHQDRPKPEVHAFQPSPSATPAQDVSGVTSGSHSRMWLLLAVVVIAIGVGYVGLDRYVLHKGISSVASSAAAQADKSITGAAPAAAFAPPPHSIAVLPFVNMSGDKEQEYFSDGLSEELLNDLTRINELQVAARTSAFSFKGKDTDVGTIARKLNVGTVLEGSVRRSVHRVRVTAQLIDAVTGYHLWSDTYDRDLGDVLNLQTEIASAVASALRVTLLRDVATEMKIGGTRNAAAYDAYLRSASGYWRVTSASDNESVRAGYQEAVRLDPNFALAYAAWSLALGGYAGNFAHGPEVGDFIRQARAPALKAVALAPDLAEGHLALAFVQQLSLDFAGASEELQRAMTLAPGSARVLRDFSGFAVSMGRTDAGIAGLQRAVVLDPLNAESYAFLNDALRSARRYNEALAAYQDGLSLRPKNDPLWAPHGALIYYALGDFEKMRAGCEGFGEAVKNLQDCLALAYHKLGRQADAETALARFKALEGNAGAFRDATIYAQWGDTPKALEWLETALQLRDPQLIGLKTEPLLDPLRQEPRFKAVERELKFPP